MKKRVLSIALVVAMIAIIAAGSFAYFTDKDEATNTFTVGNVDIKLNEVFDSDNAKLLPGKVNAVNKDVTISLEKGSSDAYVWYEWLIPDALDSKDNSTGANNIVHVNSLGRTWDKHRDNKAYWAEGQTEALPLAETWDHDATEICSTAVEGCIGTETIDGVIYNKYVVLYHGKLAAGETTTQAMDKVYMDPKVDFDGQNYTIKGDIINYNFENGVNIIVRAYGIQADGFNDVYEAYNAYQAQK